jgi:hypothetical protein
MCNLRRSRNDPGAFLFSAPDLSLGCCAGSRGFVLPVVLVLLALLVILGISFLNSTIHSKNIYQVFYRDDLARNIAESAVNEWRAVFYRRLKSDVQLQRMIQTGGKNGETVALDVLSVPNTAVMAARLVGSAFSLTGTIRVKDGDDMLYEYVAREGGTIRKKSAAKGEYQGTLRFDIRVGLGVGEKRRDSLFQFEFDLKHVCLRSDPATREKGRYSSSSTNDYVLFLRNARDEFEQKSAASLNNDRVSLSVGQSGGKGKFFFGGGAKSDPERAKKFVFLNLHQGYEFMIPKPPPDVVIGWEDLKRHMPLLVRELEDVFRQAEDKSGGRIRIFPERVKASLSREFMPLTGDQAWVDSLNPKTREVWEYFRANAAQAGLDLEANLQNSIDLFGSGKDSFDFSKLEGNLRKRFWQSTILRWDFSRITDQTELNEEIKRNLLDRAERYIKFCPPAKLSTLGPNEKELYNLVSLYQDQHQESFMSEPNDRYAFIPGYQEHQPNPPVKDPDPPFFGRTRSEPIDVVGREYLPFSAFALRSHAFADAEELYASRFYDAERNVIQLDGIMMITDKEKGFQIGRFDRPHVKYRGKGVLLSYGNILIDGSFTRESAEDGPCVLFTYQGNILANIREPGRIEASLIALHFQYTPTAANRLSRVNFMGKKVDLLGNLVADFLSIETMKPMAESSPGNKIEYDHEMLSGPDLFHPSLGGRLRSMGCHYHVNPEGTTE